MAYASCLTCFNVIRQSFQLSDADLNFGFRVFIVQLCVLFKSCFCCTVHSCSGQNMPTTILLQLTASP